MATQVKHRRGNQTEIDGFTPAIGELVMNTDTNELVLGDGVTPGGHDVSSRKHVNTVAALKARPFNANDLVTTKGYITVGKGGGVYLIKTAAQAATDGDVIDGKENFTLNNGNVAILRDLTRDGLNGFVSDKNNFAEKLRFFSSNGGKIVWVGDSITEQGKTGTGNSIGYTTYLEQLYHGTYVNEGIGGNTTLDIIERLTSIKANDGDLYVVAIGVNDIRYNDSRGATTVAEYITNITAIYNSLSESADVAFIGVWPTYWQDQFAALLRAETDRRMTQYNNALRDFCRDNSLAFSNPNPAIRTVVDFANVSTLIPDGVHPDYTGIIGKKLYADSVLIDNPRREDYSDNVYAVGKLFFKFVFGDNEQSDGLLGLKNITANGTFFQEAFGDTANLGFPFDTDLYGSYKPPFIGYFNKANDYPLITTVGVDSWPDSVVLSSIISASVGNRGAKRFETWFSTNPESVTDINHPSWVLYEKSESEYGVAVNVLPKGKTRFYYQLRLTSGGNTVDLKRIATRYPIRVATQNVTGTSEQRFDLIFGAGAGVVGDALQLAVPAGVVMWEADGEENEFTLDSFSATLADFSIYQSTDPDALSSVVHESWVELIAASGDGTYFVPRMKPADYLANSIATDVPGVVAALNTLLGRLRDSNVMKPNP